MQWEGRQLAVVLVLVGAAERREEGERQLVVAVVRVDDMVVGRPELRGGGTRRCCAVKRAGAVVAVWCAVAGCADAATVL